MLIKVLWTLGHVVILCVSIQDILSNELDELDEEFEGSLQISSVQNIHLAARREDLETVMFLKEPQNPLKKDKYGNTALHAAAQGGSLDVLKYFINEKHFNPACLGYRGGTPLHVATEHGCFDVIKYLIIEQQAEPWFRSQTLICRRQMDSTTP